MSNTIVRLQIDIERLQTRGCGVMSLVGFVPCVGIVCVMSSSASFFRAVVLPELSRPRTKMRAWRNNNEIVRSHEYT